jgi:hypothetical protein
MHKLLFHIVLLIAALVTFVSCKKDNEKWDQTQESQLSYKASTNELTIAGKSFVMDTIQLQLTDIKLTGERLQSDPISLIQVKNSPSDFLNNSTSEVLDIPCGTYTSMKLTTNLEVNGSPSLRIAGTYFFPNNNTYEIRIALDIAANYIISPSDVDGSTTVLIDEGALKNIQFLLDTEELFSEINPGLWNAAAVTSQNGAQTVVVDAMNNTNVYNALNAKIGDALTAKFQ